jgi:hypothetical protein
MVKLHLILVSARKQKLKHEATRTVDSKDMTERAAGHHPATSTDALLANTTTETEGSIEASRDSNCRPSPHYSPKQTEQLAAAKYNSRQSPLPRSRLGSTPNQRLTNAKPSNGTWHRVQHRGIIDTEAASMARQQSSSTKAAFPYSSEGGACRLSTLTHINVEELKSLARVRAIYLKFDHHG